MTNERTPDMVSVIAAALKEHFDVELEHGYWYCVCGAEFGVLLPDELHRDHQARAVLAAISEAGTVEWGVQWPFDVLGARPLETVSRSAAEATAESLAKITPKGNPAPVVVSRITGPWKRAE